MEEKYLGIQMENGQIMYMPVPLSTDCNNRGQLFNGPPTAAELTEAQRASLIPALPDDREWSAAGCPLPQPSTTSSAPTTSSSSTSQPPAPSSTSSPAVVAPAWISDGFAYSVVNGSTIRFEATNSIGTLNFKRSPDVPFTATNPDGVEIKSSDFYGAAGINDGVFRKRWEVNLPLERLRITARRANTNEEFVVEFLPQAGVTRQSLSGSGIPGGPSQPATTSQAPATTSAVPTNALQFLIVSYDCVTGVLRYKFSGQQGVALNYDIQGIAVGTATIGQVYEHIFPSDGRTGRNVTGTASQSGKTIQINFTNSCNLQPTVPETGGGGGSPSTTSSAPTQPADPTFPQYNRVVIIANSIGEHGTLNGFIVNASNPKRGMAATRPEKDFYRLLMAKHKLGNPNAEVRLLSGFGVGEETLSAVTGPFLEGLITTDVDNDWNRELVSRFAAVQAWKPELIYMRIGENINDGAWGTPGSDRYNRSKGRFKALIDTMKAGFPAAKVVLNTSVWDRPNFDQAMREIGVESDRNYPVADFSDMWRNRFSNGYYAFGVYQKLENGNMVDDEAVNMHPNDAGMARIANTLWSFTPSTARATTSQAPATTSAPPAGTTSSAPGGREPAAPYNRSYNYPTVPEGQFNDAWNYYNGTLGSGAEDRSYIVGDTRRMETSTMIIEIRKNYGCAIQLIDKSNGRPMFNWFDWGRQSAICIYSGPKTFNFGPWTFGDIGFNPIQPGNIWNVPSKILAAGMVTGNDGIQRHYSLIQLIQWNSGLEGDSRNPAQWTECYMEQWVGVLGDECDVKCRIRFNRSDQTFYDGDINNEGVTQEYPNMMTVGNDNYAYYYVGPNPGNNDEDGRWWKRSHTIEVNGASFEGDTYVVSEPFVAIEYVPGRIIAMTSPRFAMTNVNVFNLNEGNSLNEFSRPGTYTTCSVPLIMDPQGTWYHEWKWKLGSDIRAIRNWANSQPQIHGNIPDWRWTQASGRNDWRPRKGFDQREPFTSDYWKPTFRVFDGSTGGSELLSPMVAHRASLIPTIYVKMAYSGPVTRWRIEFQRNGQRNRGMEDATKPREMADRYPNRDMNGATQAFEFNIINDGQIRTYAIPTGGNPEWKDIIQQYKMKYAIGQPLPRQNDPIAAMVYFGANNPG